MKDNFKFVETKETEGMVKKLHDLAREEGRSLNNFVSRIFKKFLDSDKK